MRGLLPMAMIRLPEKSRALEFEQRRKLWEALRHTFTVTAAL
jgi:hypothetical protein